MGDLSALPDATSRVATLVPGCLHPLHPSDGCPVRNTFHKHARLYISNGTVALFTGARTHARTRTRQRAVLLYVRRLCVRARVPVQLDIHQSGERTDG